MTDRLADIEQRLDNTGELSLVVSAIRGIAAARLREAEQRLEGIRNYASTVGDAIGQALVLLAGRDATGPEPFEYASGRQLVIALCAEQGFVGGFNGHILNEVDRLCATGGPYRLIIIGDRGLTAAAERGLAADWSEPMAAHADEITALANRLTEKVFDELPPASVDSVMLVHAVPGQGAANVVVRSLIPFDFARFPTLEKQVPPLLTIPPQELLTALTEEYIYAEICEAAMLAFAAENEARMHAMMAARENVVRKQNELAALARQMRQQEITDEVIELSAAVVAEKGTSLV